MTPTVAEALSDARHALHMWSDAGCKIALLQLVDALSTPPADDVREALDAILRENHGYWPQTLDAILAEFEVRPRGAVTGAAKNAAWLDFRYGIDFEPDDLRAAFDAGFEAAMGVRS